MDERITDYAPQIIKDWLLCPYLFFSDMYQNHSVLDIACGENSQRPILEKKFKAVISADVGENLGANIITLDLAKLPRNIEVDVSFSFETKAML